MPDVCGSPSYPKLAYLSMSSQHARAAQVQACRLACERTSRRSMPENVREYSASGTEVAGCTLHDCNTKTVYSRRTRKEKVHECCQLGGEKFSVRLFHERPLRGDIHMCIKLT